MFGSEATSTTDVVGLKRLLFGVKRSFGITSACNVCRHGTQDVYPTVLEKQLGSSSTVTGTVAHI